MKLGNIVIFTSTSNQIGKSFIVKNLAMNLAEEGKKILILDFTETEKDYLEFFKFNKFNDLSKVFLNELSLQTVKLIYPENRGISIIKNKESIKFNEDFIQNFLKKIRKTYDYIFIEETNNQNMKEIAKFANKNIIITNQKTASKSKISSIKSKRKEIKEHLIILNQFDFDIKNKQEKLLSLEELFKIIDTKLVGVLEHTSENTIKKPTTEIPHSNINLAFKRISKRIIEEKHIENIENIEFNNNFSMEILYKKFDITEKKSF
jgi:septum formation inhibitor-activating ATPase MinD